MAITIAQEADDPLIFLPQVDWENFAERTIIDTY
jgi:hypothetical protein